MSDTEDINKWISGETDRFFHPGEPPKGPSFWKVGHPLIAIVGATACALTVIGFVSSRLFSAQTSISAPSAKAPPLMGILAPVPSPVKPEGFTPSSEVTRTPRPNPPLTQFPSESQSGLTEQASIFMRSYWQSVEESSDRVLPYLNSIYAPMVMYYGKLLSKEAVMRDKFYFLRNWPIRQTWEAKSPTISCNKAAAECEITGVRKYEAMNGSKHASGLVRYAYAIRFSEGSPHIVAEDSKKQ